MRCEEAVQAYIQRIREVNPILNCIVQDRFEEAIEEAKVADLMLSSKSLTIEELQKYRPLLGVPLSVKESVAVKGMF